MLNDHFLPGQLTGLYLAVFLQLNPLGVITYLKENNYMREVLLYSETKNEEMLNF